MSTSPNKRRRWHVAAFTITSAALIITGSYGVFAGLNATAFNTIAEKVTTGTLKLEVSATSPSVGFAQDIVKIVPNDSVSRYVTLTNSGTLDSQDMKFKVTSTSDLASLITSVSPHKALQVTVQRCSVAWNQAVVGSNCPGTATAIIAATDLSALQSDVNFYIKNGTSDATMTAGETANLKVTVALPDQNELVENGALPSGTVQGGTANLTFTFSELQPTGHDTNS